MSSEQSKAFLDSATQALQGGQFSQALELVEQAIALTPEDSEAFVLKGIAHSQLQQADEATEAFRHAIMLAPVSVKAYYNLAVHYFAIGQKAAAVEMAHEAVRLDPQHVGAKDLLNRVEAETRPGHPAAPDPSVHDPLAAPPEGTAGPQQPGQPAGPYQAAPQTFYRQGYESKNVHSIAFIENMGKSWDTVGYAIGAVSTVLGVTSLVQQFQFYSSHNWDFVAAQQALQAQGPVYGNMLLFLLGMFTLLMSILWMIMDITDRRGNWLWFLPYVLCCCCGLQGPVMMIYIWKGRD